MSRPTPRRASSSPGSKVRTLTRFSTVAGELGSPDTWRDVRGFSTRFYTDEGNFDMVGNNTPVFFVRDPMKFPDFIHSQKRMPDTGLRSQNMHAARSLRPRPPTKSLISWGIVACRVRGAT